MKFLGAGDSHIVVATNSPQLKVFELSTSHCQILYGHSGVCECVWSALMEMGGRCGSSSLSRFSHNFYVGLESLGSVWSSITTYFGGLFVCFLGGILWGIFLYAPDFANAALSLSRSVSSVSLTN